jgi:hypothetical protein
MNKIMRAQNDPDVAFEPKNWYERKMVRLNEVRLI